MHSVIRFLIAAFLFALVLVAFVLWGAIAWLDIGDGGISFHGLLALGLGTFFTVAVGVGLMALVFYSNSSGHDEKARDQFLGEAGSDQGPRN